MRTPTAGARQRAMTTGARPRAMAVGTRSRTVIGAVVGVALMVLVWALVAAGQPELILPSPARTWSSLHKLASNGTLIRELRRTLLRALGGVAIGLAIGIVWGVANGVSRWVAAITRPMLGTLMAVPPVVFVALGMVWLGPTESVVRLVIAIVAVPLTVVAVQEAIGDLDRDLLEMATVFEFSRGAIARHIVVPGVASPVVAALTVTISQALRVTVMAELLAVSTGVGAQVSRARANLNTADLFAWALAMVVVVIIIEVAVLQPVTARLLRWRAAATRGGAARLLA